MGPIGRLSLRLLPLFALFHIIAAEFHYDNEITGEPEIECGSGQIHFRVNTARGEASQVFVKGNSGNPDCVFHNTRNVTIELSKCNIRRKREINPNGVAYQMTVIVQLHPLFVTKVDRAYNVNCFYQEKRADVSVEVGVSDLPTQVVAYDAALPTCKYSVHRDSPNGPAISYSKVGEIIYHVWSCKSSMYSMLLSHCKVVDGKGTEYQLIDANGCSTDEYLFPQISYSSDVTTAMVETAAFNFPDRNTLYFSCKIRLCYNGENCRAVTPPKCGRKGTTAPAFTTTEPTLELAGDATTTDDLANEQLMSTSTTGRSATFKRVPTEVRTTKTLFSSSTTTTTQSTIAAAADGAESSATSSVFIPNDFPRPNVLPQGDEEHGSGEAPPEVDAWLVSEEPKSSERHDEPLNDTTLPPVQLLKKVKSGSSAPSARQPPTPKPSRQQRDATPMPKQLVDLDVTAPELTIMDDYLENEQAKSSAQRQTLRELSPPATTNIFNSRAVCFSPAALGCAVGLMVMLVMSIIVVLIKTRHKTTTHKFY